MAKSGIKTWTMLSSFVLALVFVAGCNSEETPDTAKPSAGGPAASKPADAGKPVGGTTKPDDKK